VETFMRCLVPGSWWLPFLFLVLFLLLLVVGGW
jgi:hypothetical protein